MHGDQHIPFKDRTVLYTQSYFSKGKTSFLSLTFLRGHKSQTYMSHTEAFQYFFSRALH